MQVLNDVARSPALLGVFFVLAQLPFMGVKVQMGFRGSRNTGAQPLLGMRDVCGISNLGC